MRIISQDGTVDIPYENCSVYISRFNENEIYAQWLGDETNFFSVAIYSTPEKAEKAMEMLRKAYTGSVAIFQNVESTDELKEMLKRRETEVVYAILDNHPQEIKFENHQNFYFQFPAEEELE